MKSFSQLSSLSPTYIPLLTTTLLYPQSIASLFDEHSADCHDVSMLLPSVFFCPVCLRNVAVKASTRSGESRHTPVVARCVGNARPLLACLLACFNFYFFKNYFSACCHLHRLLHNASRWSCCRSYFILSFVPVRFITVLTKVVDLIINVFTSLLTVWHFNSF